MVRTRLFALGLLPALAVLGPIAARAYAAGPANTGEIRFEIKPLIKDYGEACAVADVNRDGTPDVIAAAVWFEGPDWKKHPIRDVRIFRHEFTDTNGYHPMDLDGDGWIDIISASWFIDRVVWYENPGREGLAKGAPWKQHPLVSGTPACEGTLLEDLNGDGRAELLYNSWDAKNPVRVIEIIPGKNGAAPKVTPHDISDGRSGHGVGVGDINGDGRKDILLPEGWLEQPPDKPFQTEWKFHAVFHFERISLPCLIVDLNGDKRNDLIIGDPHGYPLRWMENRGEKNGQIAFAEHLIDKTYSQMHGLAWADLDADGRMELITGKRWRGHEGNDPGAAEPVGIYRYEWDPEKKTFTKDVITYDQGVGIGMQICVADLNADNKPDLAVAGKSGTYILLNRGVAKQTAAAQR
jgi:hypothetical protein